LNLIAIFVKYSQELKPTNTMVFVAEYTMSPSGVLPGIRHREGFTIGIPQKTVPPALAIFQQK